MHSRADALEAKYLGIYIILPFRTFLAECSVLAILPIFVSLERIDRSLMEASNDLGETPLMTFLRVTLPLSMPGVIASSLIVFIPTIGDYITPKLVGGSNGLMIANMIQLQFLKANNAPLGAALAISAMAIVGMIAIIFVLINRKHLKAR